MTPLRFAMRMARRLGGFLLALVGVAMTGWGAHQFPGGWGIAVLPGMALVLSGLAWMCGWIQGEDQ